MCEAHRFSPRGKEILENFGDLSAQVQEGSVRTITIMMLRTIAQMEEKGDWTANRREIEAFYALKNTNVREGVIMGKTDGFLEIERQTSHGHCRAGDASRTLTNFMCRCTPNEQQAAGCPLHGLRRALLPERYACCGGMVQRLPAA